MWASALEYAARSMTKTWPQPAPTVQDGFEHLRIVEECRAVVKPEAILHEIGGPSAEVTESFENGDTHPCSGQQCRGRESSCSHNHEMT